MSKKASSRWPKKCPVKAQRLKDLRWKSGSAFNLCERFHSYQNEWYKVFNSPGIVGVTDECLASWILRSTPEFLIQLLAEAIEDGFPADSMVCHFFAIFTPPFA